MRRRRALRMVTALIMAAAIGPRAVFVKVGPSFRVRCDRPALGADPLASPRNAEINLDCRIPRRRCHPVTAAVLFDVGEAWERIVEALQLQLLGGPHVV